jgi:hypothetical protein
VKISFDALFTGEGIRILASAPEALGVLGGLTHEYQIAA